MKHIRTYKQHLEEGLIKTVSVDEFIKHLNKMMTDKGYFKMTKRAQAEDTGHVYLFMKMNPNIMDFAKDLVSLININGYYVASVGFNDEGGEEYEHKAPKTNEEFLSIIKNWKKDVGAEVGYVAAISLEPKFEEESKNEYKILYHITEEKHLDKILKQGLVPRAKSKVSYHPERIYLANKYSIAHIYEKYSEYVENPVILSVNVKGLKIYPDINAPAGAYFTTTNIGPDKIKVLKEDPKKFVEKYRKAHQEEEDEEFRQYMQNAISNLLGRINTGVKHEAH